MIYEISQLPSDLGEVALVDGGFDPLHSGHIEYIQGAAKLGLPLVCNLASDEYIQTKHPVLQNELERASILQEFSSISHVIYGAASTEEALRRIRPKFYVKGKDWAGRLPRNERETCDQLNIEIIYLDTMRNSSSKLVQTLQQGGRWTDAEALAALTKLVSEQVSVQQEHYSSEYFAGDWRAEGNKYTLETRRAIEGRNPELIKQVFSPQQVLDLGCGPGFLLELLREIGVSGQGVDFALSSLEICPEGVRESIKTGNVDDPHLLEGREYDLVICREVLEHLTVLQVKKTIANMCRLSSRFVYLTTRFTENERHLLEVSTQFEVDPTHITLLTKNFVRLLFILEGYVERTDLAESLDWLKKNRVLVFEKRSP